MIVNGVCLFYVSYARQQWLFHFLVLVYEKEVAFVPKSGQIVVKVDGLTLSYKTDRPTAKSDISLEEKSKLEKGIDWIYYA